MMTDVVDLETVKGYNIAKEKCQGYTINPEIAINGTSQPKTSKTAELQAKSCVPTLHSKMNNEQ